MFAKSALMTKSEQDRQTVMKRAEKMNADYAKELDAFDKDHRARMEAAEQRRLAALKQKIPMAHHCPASGECEECAEKQRKLKAAMKAMQKAAPKKAFKKKTLNRQLSRSADDISLVFTEKSTTKSTKEVGANSQKDSTLNTKLKSAKFTMKPDSVANGDGIVTKVTSAMMGWMGMTSDKNAEPDAPAVPLAGSAKDAIVSAPMSTSTAVAYVEPTTVQYGDGYLEISQSQNPKTNAVTVTMQQRARSLQSSSKEVTKSGTTKETVKASQREQQKVRMSMK